MADSKVSEAQMKANKKWKENNKERMNYIRKRSAARGFIKIASIDDLAELEQLITERKNILPR